MKRQGAIDADMEGIFTRKHEADGRRVSSLVITHNSGCCPSSQQDENSRICSFELCSITRASARFNSRLSSAPRIFLRRVLKPTVKRTKVRAPRAMSRLPLVVTLALLMSAAVTIAED